ncbi:MAG: ester cyclase [Thermoleophilia bacterium]|nr:ester cyclase [Thermoleophilia bacterium]
MASNENTELVERFYAEAINQKDATACERLLTDDFVHNNEFRGRTGQQAAVDAFLAAFPDLEVKVMMTVAEDDKVAAHQRWRGTHEGEFIGIAGTGKKVEFTSTAILLIHDGMIAQAWDELDLFGLSAQLQS